MGGGRRNSGDPVKVVIINTQYVETDTGSFKSVVQNLTGKHSTVYTPQQYPPPSRFQSAVGVSEPVLSRGLSFKDFERMLKELPPLDELCRLYAG